jgi:hypothetical protein
MELLFAGRWMGVEEAKRWALVNEVVLTDLLLVRVREIADLLAVGPASRQDEATNGYTSRERQLAKEAAILYCPADGSIDLIASGGGAARKAVAALFVEPLFHSEDRVENLKRGRRRAECPDDRRCARCAIAYSSALRRDRAVLTPPESVRARPRAPRLDCIGLLASSRLA